ncbi:hypothetical protein ISF9_100 [Microbacterium phage vB_MoxS-ISF9]|uniref:Uncharacterized protein n=1 Tax=Microbacterium phage vB_MoxS-ISF9 TaxID=1458670 RepID=W8NNP4_9CAUD|nr:hypothetical protein ISF9_100 [Microbacterium phage vB_MoxS-ISF9]AHL18570.1 hypothetical protein ISF9_100 [Microbacterium phage vB_MoxS-ISF9]
MTPARKVALFWAIAALTALFVRHATREDSIAWAPMFCVAISSIYGAAAFIVDAIERKK